MKSALLFLLCLPTSAFACGGGARLLELEELVGQASSIYLAQATAIEEEIRDGLSSVNVVFRVVNVHKGQVSDTTTYHFNTLADIPESAVDHHSAVFWEEGRGNSVLAPDCTFLPTVKLGSQYLITEGVHDPRVYEPVTSSEDPWLQAVLAEARGADVNWISMAEFLSEKQAVVLGRCVRSPQRIEIDSILLGREFEHDGIVWKSRTSCARHLGKFFAYQNRYGEVLYAFHIKEDIIDMSGADHPLLHPAYKSFWLVSDLVALASSIK